MINEEPAEHIHIIPIVPINRKSKIELEKEQPGLEMMKCPDCQNHSWISAKKRWISAKISCYRTDVKYKIQCWDCIEKEAEEMRSLGFEVDAEMRMI